MEWYVYRHDFNTKKMVKYNIFNHAYVNERIEKLLKDYITFNDFVEKLDKLMMSCFWSKCEYEFFVYGWFDEENSQKVNVYDQLKPNMKILARYIIDCYNERKRKKLEI